MRCQRIWRSAFNTPLHPLQNTEVGQGCPALTRDILPSMESLGHYLLRERIALPGVGAVEAFEGQDVRTGIDVLVFRPISEPPPTLSIPHSLSWIDQEEDAWIAEIPVGAVQAAWLAGRVDVARLTQWCKQLLLVLNRAQESKLPIGYIIPELVWARGSRVWLGGVGVPSPEQTWDFAGLLKTIKVLAGEAYPALPWCKALEDYVSGQLEYAELMAQLDAPVPGQASPPRPSPDLGLAGAGGYQEAPADRPGSEAPLPQAEPGEARPEAPPDKKPTISKSLRVQINEPPTPAPTATPPRRIRIEERLEPPFEVLEPPPSRRATTLWLWLIPLVLLAGGVGLWLRARTSASSQVVVYPVEFRLQPPGPSASLVILEVPEGSKLPLNAEVALLPGRVEFDKPGIYRIRVRVQGRAPVESLIEVPNPGGVTINLK